MKYKSEEDVPTKVLCKRLKELSDAVTKGQKQINREFYMSIPARPHIDADLVLAEAARRLKDTK